MDNFRKLRKINVFELKSSHLFDDFLLHSDILWGFVSVSSLLEYIKQFQVHFQKDKIP